VNFTEELLGDRVHRRLTGMPYYNLTNNDEPNNPLCTQANDCDHALAIFGNKIGVTLTLETQDIVAPYLLAESEDDVHWISATIPVWISN
jgi:hypothetical protein